MSHSRHKYFHAANVLTFYRLVTAPAIAALAFWEEERLFIALLCISFITDVLDGLIARAWNLSTEFGSRLDSIADVLTYAAAIVGIFQFKYEALKPHIFMLYLFVGMLIIATIAAIIKYRTIPSFHLISFKANALFQAIFIFCLFVFGFNLYIYYFVMCFGILASLELIAVAFVLNAPISDVKSLISVLSKKKYS